MNRGVVTDRGVLLVGEALVDIVHHADGSITETPGGSPANVALSLARLGHAPRLMTQLADDAHGRRVRELLEDSGVTVLAAPAARTSTATATLNAAREASYEFDLVWELDDAPWPRSGIVHTGSIGALLEPGATTVRARIAAAHDDALVTYDPNVRPALFPDRDATRAHVEAFLAIADVVKASADDLEWLYPDRSLADTARVWLAAGPAVVVVTEGAEGAFAMTAAHTVRAPGHRVQVVDTVGAGDSFMGALLHGLISAGLADATARNRLTALDEETLRALLSRATAASAITVSRAGANPPRLSELSASASY